MDTHQRVHNCIQRARYERRCIVAGNAAELRMLERAYQAGRLLKPHAGIYAEPSIWNNLDNQSRSIQVSSALVIKHAEWVFAGLSAAAIYHLGYRSSLHTDGNVYIATRSRSRYTSTRHLQYVHTPENEYVTVPHSAMRVTSVAQTLISCAARYEFRDALAMFDSALRAKLVTKNELLSTCRRARRNSKAIRTLIQHSTPASESVGESLCRGTMLEAMFPDPRMQVIHSNPYNPGHTYRTDFEFTAADGGTVIVEFDGMQKYTDPTMGNRRSLAQRVHAEQKRERALASERGVKCVLRFDYDDVMRRTPLIAALQNAGIPRSLPQIPTSDA